MYLDSYKLVRAKVNLLTVRCTMDALPGVSAEQTSRGRFARARSQTVSCHVKLI